MPVFMVCKENYSNTSYAHGVAHNVQSIHKTIEGASKELEKLEELEKLKQTGTYFCIFKKELLD